MSGWIVRQGRFGEPESVGRCGGAKRHCGMRDGFTDGLEEGEVSGPNVIWMSLTNRRIPDAAQPFHEAFWKPLHQRGGKGVVQQRPDVLGGRLQETIY